VPHVLEKKCPERMENIFAASIPPGDLLGRSGVSVAEDGNVSNVKNFARSKKKRIVFPFLSTDVSIATIAGVD
jgi:hypothetical protein